MIFVMPYIFPTKLGVLEDKNRMFCELYVFTDDLTSIFLLVYIPPLQTLLSLSIPTHYSHYSSFDFSEIIQGV